MAKSKKRSNVFLLRQIELTEKYFEACLNPCIGIMLALIKQCNLKNINREDCEDMYNEFFVIAVKTYNKKRGPFDFYLKKVVKHKTLTVIRRVIAGRDPLFYSLSLDRVLDCGIRVDELLGTKDPDIKSIGEVFASPNQLLFSLEPLDQQILFYKGCGYSIREIAEKLGVSMSSVQRRLQDMKTNRELLKSMNVID